MNPVVRVTKRGAERWAKGHPWIFASDVDADHDRPGIVTAIAGNGRPLGQALFSPTSELRLRLLEPRPNAVIDLGWWRSRVRAALDRRIGIDATAYRVVHAEGDGLPSLIVDRYDKWIVAQLLSAGLESVRADVIAAIEAELAPDGILLRHDVNVRRHEGLPLGVEVAHGAVPEDIEVREGSVRYLAAPWTGQKTGAFLDQRESRFAIAGRVPPGGRALDCFSYHGSFALHLASRAGEVVALDSSADALARGAVNARLNGFGQIRFVEADAFDELRAMERRRERFDVIVVDPPAFAKTKGAVSQALRGYKEINLRAIKLACPGGWILSASCSYHVGWPAFLEVIAAAAADAGRRVTLAAHLVQPSDHPEIATIPETGYLKAVLLRVD